MDRERIDEILERLILGLVALLLVYSALAFGAVRATEFVVVIVLVLLLLAAWLVRLWLAPQAQLLWPPVCWAVLAFVAYAFWRGQAAPVQWEARREVLRIVVYAAVFFVVLNNLYRQDPAKWLTVLLAIVGLAMALYALTQYLTQDQMVWHLFKPPEYVGRGSGPFIYPNHLAGYLTMLLPLMITFTLASRLSHPARIVTGYAAVVMLGGVAVTLSRGGWLATLVALLLLVAGLFSLRQYRIPAVVVLVAILAGGFFFYTKAQRRVEQRVAAALDRGHDRDPRWRLWEAALQVWQDRPWVGHGPGHFDLVYPKYRQPVNTTQLRPNFALSEYVNTLTDYGAVGALLIAVVFGWVLGGAVRTWQALSHSANHRDELRGGKRAFVMGAGIGLVGLLAACVTDFQMHLPANAILAVTLMALLAGHLRFVTDRYWVPLSRPSLVVITAALLVAGGYMGQRGWQAAQYEYWMRQAATAKAWAPELAALRRAVEIDPLAHQAAYQLGEYYRRRSWQGNSDYQAKALEAIPWFKRALELNPYDSYALIRLGMCWDWLGRHAEAEPYFRRALELDPHNFYILCHMGWHYFQVQKYAQARAWMGYSLRLNWVNNPLAYKYHAAASQRIEEERRLQGGK